MTGTPTGDFHPISSCPCRAYTSASSRPPKVPLAALAPLLAAAEACVPARCARRNAALTSFAACSRALGAEPGHFTGQSVLIASGDPATPAGERRISRKTMNTISGRISKDYGWEVTVFHKLRETSDGVVFFHGKINWDRYLADHSPRFEIHLVMFNYTIIEINIYYLHHRD